MSTVAVIDYGMGNLHSISKALQHAAPDVEVVVTSDAETILKADRVVFPGVGAMRDCMKALHDLNLVDVIKQVAETKPLLGICLGMQALLIDSQENGHTDCLGILDGHVLKFADPLLDENGEILKVPHMGWNQVKTTRSNDELLANIHGDPFFYFVHSYYVKPTDEEVGWLQCNYGSTFCAAVRRDRLVATQFHPEKSQRDGLQLLTNFLRM